MTAKKILEMIETVDPGDTAKLDEIDARVWCWLKGENADCDELGMERWKYAIRADEYTRSRDALKAIRPEGWILERPINVFDAEVHVMKTGHEWRRFPYFNDSPDIVTPDLPTEELAELHAIIQAIAYERAGG